MPGVSTWKMSDVPGGNLPAAYRLTTCGRKAAGLFENRGDEVAQ